eukprot:779457-Pelagomonas_calceolata.AAC.1
MSKTIKDDLERTQKADLSEAEIKGIYYQLLGKHANICKNDFLKKLCRATLVYLQLPRCSER